jgi:hypothetical protein
MIPPDAQRAMSKRVGASVAEAKGSNAIYVSQPQVVGDKRAAQNKVVKMMVSSECTKVAGLGTSDSTKQAQNAG